MAVNRRWQNRQTNEWEEATSFFDVVCWGTLAENVAQSLTRGSRVIVSGRLDQRSWENQEGEKRSKVEIVADEVAPEPALGHGQDREERAPQPRRRRRRRPRRCGASPGPCPTQAPSGYTPNTEDEEPF